MFLRTSFVLFIWMHAESLQLHTHPYQNQLNNMLVAYVVVSVNYVQETFKM